MLKKKINVNSKILYTILSVSFAVLLAVFCIFAGYYLIEREFIYPLKYKAEIYRYADEFNLERALVFAVVKTESDFDDKAISPVGAIGLMQITEKTGEYVAEKLDVKEYDLFSPNINIRFGCYYIKYLIERFEKVDTALIAYNAGEGNVEKWLADNNYSKDGKTLITTPFKETNAYILKIKKNFSKYKKLYGNILDKRQNFE